MAPGFGYDPGSWDPRTVQDCYGKRSPEEPWSPELGVWS